jgi:hypothetical protein
MSKSVWIYVDGPTRCVKVFASYSSAFEWLQNNDPDGLAVEYPVDGDESGVSAAPRQTDVRSVVDALLTAKAILAHYLQPGFERDYAGTMKNLLDALTNHDVIAAVGRIEHRRRFKVHEGR